MSTDNYIVVTVSSIPERDKLIKRIYTNLTKEPSLQFTIQQDQINRIKIFHNAGPGIQILIRTYLVIVIPVLVDLNPLYSLYGTIDFKLDETIAHLQSLIDKLQKLQGRRVIKGRNNESTFRSLVEQLRSIG